MYRSGLGYRVIIQEYKDIVVVQGNTYAGVVQGYTDTDIVQG
jgi:hypothetical protein